MFMHSVVAFTDDKHFTEEWYFILAVCGAGALLIAAAVLLLWFIIANRKYVVSKEVKHVQVRYHKRGNLKRGEHQYSDYICCMVYG